MELAKKVVLGLLAFATIFWLLFLAGVAGLHIQCVKTLKDASSAQENFVSISGNRRLLVRSLLSKEEGKCRTDYGLRWWLIWFQLLCIVLAFLTSFKPKFKRWSGVNNLYITIVSALLMYYAQQAQSYIWENKDRPEGNISTSVTAYRTALAGIVGLLMFNLVFLWFSADKDTDEHPVGRDPRQQGIALQETLVKDTPSSA